jgi:hypothetical protein
LSREQLLEGETPVVKIISVACQTNIHRAWSQLQNSQIVYRSKAERESELLHQQQEFSSRITRVMMSEPATDVIYIDETTFHLWMQPARGVDKA